MGSMDVTVARARRWSRLEGSFAREDDFGIVLVLILLTIISFSASAGEISEMVSVALSGGTLLFIMHTAGARKRIYRLAVVIVVLAILGTAIALALGDDDLGRSAASLVGLLLAVVAPLIILRRILTAARITIRLVLGAMCVYLLLGLAYAYLFPLVATMTGVPFFVQTRDPGAIDYAYFSYTTLATVGYGDFTAATSVGRMIAISEGLVGQLFLVSAVALLVGNVGRAIRPGSPAGPAAPPAAEEPPLEEKVTPPGR
jgi:hypothetical protein